MGIQIQKRAPGRNRIKCPTAYNAKKKKNPVEICKEVVTGNILCDLLNK